ncbi:MAG: BatA domain-containing protein [Phycisphaerales bacterium]|nr:MAG: BatA domain-containing protein [Phycisphaerales bacterium]
MVNPALWVGVAALAVPLAIHLLTRRTPKNMTFPTLRFLRAARAHQSRLYHLRHLLLLLTRMALLLLILLAFLRPVLMQGARRKATSQTGRTMLILMDVSASMGYVQAGVSPLAEARAAVLEILDHHEAGDRVNLILMKVAPDASFDEPSDNLFLLRRDLANAAAVPERPDINAAIAEAVSQLKGVTEGRRQIYFISDFQRTNWSSVNFDQVDADTELLFVPVGPERGENCAITDVALRPAAPTVSEDVEIVCKVTNYSDRPRRLPLQMRFRDGEDFQQEVRLEPRATVSSSFHLRIHDAGQYEGQVFIPEDGLKVDDRRSFVLDVAEKVRVLVVSDDDPRVKETGAAFLRRAINPFAQKRNAAVVSSVVSSRDVDKSDLARAQVVILSGIHELSRRSGEAILEYLETGGSVAYFHVASAASQNLERLAAWSEGNFVLPFELSGQIDLSRQEGYATLAQANFDHRILRKFRDSADLGDLRFHRFFSTERVKNKGRVLLRYDDGNIAMAETLVGPGVLLLCNFGCSLQHSDIVRHPLFVPLVHEIIRGLRPSMGRKNTFLVGQPCFTTLRPLTDNEKVVLRGPAGETVEGSVEANDDGVAVLFPKTSACGFYRAYVGEEIAASAAVNLDSLESNLERLDMAQLEELAQQPRATYLAAGDVAGIEGLLEGEPLWHYFLLAAVGLLFVEQVLVLLVRH